MDHERIWGHGVSFFLLLSFLFLSFFFRIAYNDLLTVKKGKIEGFTFALLC